MVKRGFDSPARLCHLHDIMFYVSRNSVAVTGPTSHAQALKTLQTLQGAGIGAEDHWEIHRAEPGVNDCVKGLT